MGILRSVLIVVVGLLLTSISCVREPASISTNANTSDEIRTSAIEHPTFSSPSPIKINLSVSKIPILNEKVKVTCVVVSQSDAPKSTAEIKLPKGTISRGGALDWQGDLKANVPISFSAQITFKQTGHQTVQAIALHMVDDKNVWGDVDYLYLDIGVKTSNFGWPAESVGTRSLNRWSVIDLDFEVSHAPKLNEPAQLSITILSPVDFPGLTAEIIFFKGVKLLEGIAKQPIDLKADVPLHLSATVVFTETGNRTVSAGVSDYTCGPCIMGPEVTIYFNIGVENSTYWRDKIRQHPPVVTTVTSEWQNPIPQGNTLLGIWGSSPSDVFAVGWEGTILHYDGTNWNKMVSGTDKRLNAVWGTSPSNVFAVGEEGTILHYDGSAWTNIADIMSYWIGGNWISGIWGSSSSDVFAVGDDIWHYDGKGWTNMTPCDFGPIYYDVWGNSGSDVFAVGSSGTILHYDGRNWNRMHNSIENDYHNMLMGIWGSSSTNMFIVGEHTLHFDGAAWRQPADTSGGLLEVWGSSPTDVFAVGHYILHYDGSKWSQMDDGSAYGDNILRDVWGFSPSDVFAVGDYGTILHYDGKTWKNMIIGTKSNLRGIWGTSSSDIFAAGDDCAVVHYDGKTWTPMKLSQQIDGTLNDIWGTSSSDVFAVGGKNRPRGEGSPAPFAESVILHYDGDTWSVINIGTTGWLNGIWGSSSSDVFAVGYNGIILHYDGEKWSKMTSSTHEMLYRVWGSSPSDVYAVGYPQIILHYNGKKWSKISSGTYGTLHDIWGSSPTDIFIIGCNAFLHYDGKGWRTLANGTGMFHSLWASSPSDIFAVGEYGRMIHYDGNACNTLTIGTFNNLYGIWGSSSSDVFAVGDGGTILNYPR